MHFLCTLQDVPEGESRGFEFGPKSVVAVMRDGQLYTYLNWCPHTQVLLDQVPGKFFDPEHTYIRCGMHAARFRVEDGFCIDGPCEGESLKPLKIEIQDGAVYLVE